MDDKKFHMRMDELICGWSAMHGHSFTENELNALVDLLGEEVQLQAVKIHAAGVRAGKEIAEIRLRKRVAELEGALKSVTIDAIQCEDAVGVHYSITDWSMKQLRAALAEKESV